MHKTIPIRPVLFILFFLAVLTIPFITDNTYHLHVMINIFNLAVLTTGFRFMVRTGRFSLGHLVFLGIGSYATAILTTEMGFNPWIGIFIGGIIAVLVAVLLGRIVLRLGGIYFAILTLSVAQVFRFVLILAKQVTGGTQGIVNIPGLDLGILGTWSSSFEAKNVTDYYIMFFIALFAIGTMALMERSRIGATMSALGSNDQLAEHLGISQMKYRLIAFCTGAFFAGITGAFNAHYIHFTSPDDFSVFGNIFLVVYAVVGGLKSPIGPTLGSASLVLFIEFLRVSSSYQPIIYGAMIIIVILLIPDGLVSLPARFQFLWSKIRQVISRKPLHLDSNS